MELLMAELVTLKASCSAAKVFKAKAGTPTFPFPVAVHLTIPKPPSATAFDVDSLTLRITFAGGGGNAEDEVSVGIEPSADLPPALASAIASSLDTTWKQQLAKQREGAAGGAQPGSWLLKGLLTLVTAKFANLLQILPECVETYQGCDDLGATMRRFMLVTPREEPAAGEAGEGSESGSSDDEDGSDEDEMDDEARAFWEEQERRKAETASQKASKDANESEARRQEVLSLKEKGIDVDGPKQLSKKEQEELKARKRGQGNRLAKTGSKANKFAGEGSALAREEGKKKSGAK